jgi:putative peptidoglycan lipid II flippase
MFGKFLNSQSKTIAMSAIILAASASASRVLGIARDWLLAEYFGAGTDLDVYFAAFRVPDFIYNILVFGGIVVAFLPLFSDYYAKNKEEAWRFANNTLNAFLVFLIGLCLILFLFTPQLALMIAPGFSPAQLEKLVLLTRLMFLSPILFGAASIFSGVLQYFNRFVAYSIAPILYNLGIIAGIVVLSPVFGITGVALGVIGGALFYLLIQIPPALKCGFCYRLTLNFKDGSLKKVFDLMIPRTFGIAANQINQIVTTAVASVLSAGSVTIFNLANNLYSFPVGIFGVSYALAAFPAFSKNFAESNIKELAEKFSSSARQIGYIVLPLGFLMFVLRDPIVSLVYYHGRFSEQAASLTAASLGLFCLGIYFASIMPLIFRLFFAFHDTASPTISTVVSVAANVVLNFAFIDAMRTRNIFSGAINGIFGLGSAANAPVLGLAIAFTLSNAIQLAVLVLLLYRKDRRVVKGKEIFLSFAKALAAGAAMFAAVDLAAGAANAKILTATPLAAAAYLAVFSVFGAAIYVVATILLKAPEYADFKTMAVRALARLRNRPDHGHG